MKNDIYEASVNLIRNLVIMQCQTKKNVSVLCNYDHEKNKGKDDKND